MKITGKFTFFILMLLAVLTVDGQNGFVTSGGVITGAGGSASFSTGQVAFTVYKGVNGSVAAGVQQAYEISVVTSAGGTENIMLNCSAYPNPATDFLFLQMDSYTYDDITWRLYDASGALLKTQKVESETTTIPMSEYVAAIYYLKVSSTGLNLKTFKIMKH